MQLTANMSTPSQWRCAGLKLPPGVPWRPPPSRNVYKICGCRLCASPSRLKLVSQVTFEVKHVRTRTHTCRDVQRGAHCGRVGCIVRRPGSQDMPKWWLLTRRPHAPRRPGWRQDRVVPVVYRTGHYQTLREAQRQERCKEWSFEHWVWNLNKCIRSLNAMDVWWRHILTPLCLRSHDIYHWTNDNGRCVEGGWELWEKPCGEQFSFFQVTIQLFKVKRQNVIFKPNSLAIKKCLLKPLTRAHPGGWFPPPSGFLQIMQKRRRAAPPLAVHSSFPHIVSKFWPRVMSGQVTSPHHVTQPPKKFEDASKSHL